MLLILMLLATNFCSTASIGDLGPIYAKQQKLVTSWTTVKITKHPPASGFYGHLQYQYDDDQESTKRIPYLQEIEFEPVVNPVRHIQEAGINCDDFNNYAYNCTKAGAYIYNSINKSPPMPAKIGVWCQAIRLLTNCAIDWNSECKDVTESHFNEESIKGHMHVANNICDDDWFLAHYDNVPACIDRVTSAWEICYVNFKLIVDDEKNRTQEWTHFSTHFNLCCARTTFRRCTLEALFMDPNSKCPHEEAIILQKYSVIVSEGEVFQDCDKNMLYHNCPGGDPRPPTQLLYKLMNAETSDKMTLVGKASRAQRETLSSALVIVICLIKLCL